MFIRNCLTPKNELTLLQSSITIKEALSLMQGSHYSLPVVNEEGSYLGILSKRSILEYMETQDDRMTLTSLYEHEISNCIDVSANDSVDLHASHFEDCLPIIVRYPFVPVLDNGTFVGIVKRSFIERTLEDCFGVGVDGTRILIGVHNQSGTLHTITKILHKYDINIISDIAFEADSSYLRRILIKIEKSPHLDKVTSEIEKHGFRILEIE
ncbi:CBS domain protein [Alkalihalophilus pseudofirmus OF4]|uniref:CBS domain protein n=1 Tax=Alkalihalophilus pseudofirmus (strain ATCC BAA-2126 / JCM 17055 / OF4) TaxID=398511 RepID=D3FRT9_ALKPO|nr:CBS domain-containing protein [Alkalihalophilus pseudofirmus]ADC49849.1 CBS domain protein [Alkalihalophilus pseudofirmus OF4]